MSSFQSLFPNFPNDCRTLQQALYPAAFLLLVIGIVSSIIAGHRSGSAYLRAFGRTFVYVALLTQITVWGNQVSQVVDDTVRNQLHADPSQVQQAYMQKLEIAKGDDPEADRSWFDKLGPEAIFEAGLSILLYAIGGLAGIILTYAYILQKFVLYLGYALSPIFIGFLAVRTLQSIGISYLLNLTGVMLWPLGWGAASIATRGLLDFMTDQSFLTNGGIFGSSLYTLQGLMGIGALGLWIIFSTIAAPLIIQKAVSNGIQVGQAFAAGAASAGTAAVLAGAGAMAAGSSPDNKRGTAIAVGGLGAMAAGIAAVESSVTGSSHSQMGSLLGSLTGAYASQKRPPRPDKDDLSGDRAAAKTKRMGESRIGTRPE